MKIIIIGSGIIGALTGFRLAQAGAQVTVIDAGQPAAAASGASFGWINASFFHDEDHFRLRLAAIDAHERLASDLGSGAVTWSGALCWEETGAAFDAQLKALEAMGYAARVVERAEFMQLEPAIPAPDRSLLFAQEGAADLPELTRDAIRAAVDLGARWVTGVSVTGIEHHGGAVTGVQTGIGRLSADRVVVAAGTATEGLLADLDVALPMLHRPGVILRSEALPPMLNHVLASPEQELRQTPAGHLLAPAAANHQSDRSDRIDTAPEPLADAAMARVSVMLGRPLRWEQMSLADRPMPRDGLPVIGGCGPEGLYVTTLHSGATLAPLVAELATAEITESGLSNTQSALVTPYRPQRFTV